MIIKSAVTGKDMDTDKITPEGAGEVFAQQHQLVELAIRKDVPFFAVTLADDSYISRFLVRVEESDKPEVKENYAKVVNRLFSVFDSTIREISGNTFCICANPNPSQPKTDVEVKTEEVKNEATS